MIFSSARDRRYRDQQEIEVPRLFFSLMTMTEKEGALREASKTGDVATVNKLLEENVHQTPDENGDTPLHLATSSYLTMPEHVEVVRALLNTDTGADVNLKNKDGNSAVHNAASNGNLEIMELFLENGADIQTEGQMGMVPLGLAAIKKHHAVVNVLVKNLIGQNAFSKIQVEWMNKAQTATQQMHIFRALTAIFAERSAIVGFIKFGVIESILNGMKRFKKNNIHTSGLQLLTTLVSVTEGVAHAQGMGQMMNLEEVCKDNIKDPVTSHLINEVASKLS